MVASTGRGAEAQITAKGPTHDGVTLYEDKFVQVGEIRARYWSAGREGPPVLLIHGIGSSVQLWRPVLDALSQNNRVLAVDLPGFGRSDKPDASYTPDYMVRFVRDFLDVVGLSRVAVIGHSYGGAVAARLALDSPETVARLGLVAPAGFGRRMNPLFLAMTVPALGEVFSLPSRAGIALLLGLSIHHRRALTSEIVEETYQLAKLPGAQRGLMRTLRALATPLGQRKTIVRTILARLPEISVPTLVLWGLEDRILPNAVEKAQAIPGVRIETLNECGHIPWIEYPEVVNRALNEFMQTEQ